MSVPERWRFSLDNEKVSLQDMSWRDALEAARTTEAGNLAAQADGECVQCEFNPTHAAVLYMGRDERILRPYLPDKPAAAQDLTPFFCGGCGIRVGPKDQYLARFFDRETGFQLFNAVLCGPPLPGLLPEAQPDQTVLPGFERLGGYWSGGRSARDDDNAEPSVSPD